MKKTEKYPEYREGKLLYLKTKLPPRYHFSSAIVTKLFQTKEEWTKEYEVFR